MLDVRGVSKSFGTLQAVRDVSLAVRAGEIRALIGPNGAGKTTFFSLVSGATRSDTGTIHFGERDITHAPAHRRVQLGMSRTFQVPSVFLGLSVRDNLWLGLEAAAGLNLEPWLPAREQARLEERTAQLLERLRLTEKAHTQVAELAHGDQRVVEIGLALSRGAKLLLLDEPTAGMSDEETQRTIALIRALRDDEQVTIVFIEHDMGMVFDIADAITVLHLGAVLAEGSPEQIARNEAVQDAYLGREREAG